MDKLLDYLSILPKCIVVYLIDMIPADSVFLFAPSLPANAAAWIFWMDILKGILFIVFTGMAIVSMPLLRKLIRIKRYKKVTKDLFEKVDFKEELEGE